MQPATNTYRLESWSSNGVRLADITALARNRIVVEKRNAEEELSFEVDLDDVEAFCLELGVNPRELFSPLRNEIKVRRNGEYWRGFQVIAIDFNFPKTDGVGFGSGSLSRRVRVLCTGYLNFFKQRFITKTYVQVDPCAIAADVITTLQAEANGDYGVTISGANYSTGVLRDRTYERRRAKDLLQELTNDVGSTFDFDFGPDKVFRTYQQAGSRRTDLALVYGGLSSNAAGFELARTATTTYNRVIALGSGFGADQLVSVADDVTAQSLDGLREEISLHNSVILQPTLDTNAAADLTETKDVLNIPIVTVTGLDIANVPPLVIGDRIPVRVRGHTWLDDIDGLYRLERMVTVIDDNDYEREINLYFDDKDVDQGE